MATGLSRRRVLLSAAGVAACVIATAGCGSTRNPLGIRRRPNAGALRWRTIVPGSVLAAAEAADTLGLVLGGGLRGLSASNGKQSWSLSGRQGDYLNLTAVGGKVFIVSNPVGARRSTHPG